MSIRDEAWERACRAWDAMKKANPPSTVGPVSTFHGKPTKVDRDPMQEQPRGLAAWLPTKDTPPEDFFTGIRHTYAPVIIPKGALDVRKALEDAWEACQRESDIPHLVDTQDSLDALLSDANRHEDEVETGPGIAALKLAPPRKALDMSTWADDFDLLEDA